MPLILKLIFVASGLLSLSATTAFAQAWPARPIELVHGFGAGGNADTVARVIAAPLSEALGKPINVIARPGAGGNIASDYVARSQPDGYTLGLLVGGHSVSAALYKRLAFDPLNDFAFISSVSVNPFVIAVRKDSPIRDLPDLISRAKGEPGRFTFSSVGVGSTQHLTGEMFALRAGIRLTHVPYRGGVQALTDLLGGSIDMMVDTITVTRAAIEQGQIRALGVTSAETWPALPDTPPIKFVIPDFSVISWIGIAAPARTPSDIIERLAVELKRTLADADVRRKLEQSGARVQASTPEELRQLVSSEIARWSDIIAKAGIEKQ